MKCVSVYNQNCHMQGFASDDEHKFMYWSFTDSVVKTTMSGTMICQAHNYDGGHLGGMDYHDGKVYISYMLYPEAGRAWNDWAGFKIYVYDAFDLKVLDIIDIPECHELKAKKIGGFQGIDGITFGKDPETGKERMFAACAVDNGENYDYQMLLQFGDDNKIEKIHKVKAGNTVFGIQNLDYEPDTGYFWTTTYGKEQPYQTDKTLFCLDLENKRVVESYKFSTPYGFECLGNGEYLCSLQSGVNGARNGCAYKCNKEFFKNSKTEAEINDYIKALSEK